MSAIRYIRKLNGEYFYEELVSRLGYKGLK